MHQDQLGGVGGGVAGSSPDRPAITGAEFETMYPSLRRFAAAVGDSDIDPDDLVQEALARYLRRFAGSDGARDPEAYLRTAIWGLLRNQRRALGRGQRLRIDATQAHLDEYPSDVQSLLALTSPEERALLLLVDVDGEPIGVAAATLGISGVAARARLSRVRRRLRSEIGGSDGR